ncbi:nitronate monooxygenase [Pseudoglutamicibacter cumminsii]|uniref:Probable nitronate monooxygenase n=1 Tax=Pseudoglutamicibacter cumminsii TaxID=156979 RepID=A0AAP4FGM0_9MICC|nr:nitronate monooxygenase [Pseudoglutamicibacter cumminsii]MDK6275067.1 nitronate monooxygenase [Pseudoglutamicibacter cumminsii]PWI27202.1 nitronate monooxygenase [Pseudoglutamicibacter cumminsii]
MRNPSAFTDLTGIDLPFVGAPMAGTSTPQLAAAVSNAGGLGSLGLAGKSVDQVREAVRELKTLTTRPFNLNFFCHAEPHRDPAVESAWIDYLTPLFDSLDTQPPAELSPSYDSFLGDTAMLQLLLEEKPAVVSFHFGVPDAATINALHDAGILLMASATNPEEERVIEEAGLDAVIAQGIEAGGHRGIFNENGSDEQTPTAALVEQIASTTQLPVVAAGGIMTREHAEHMFSLGAAAVQAGTALITTPESMAKDSYRDALVQAAQTAQRAGGGAETHLTRVFSGRPARGLSTAFMDFAQAPDAPTPPVFPVAYSANKVLSAAAAKSGTPGMAPHWSGANVHLIQPRPAAEVTRAIGRDR